MQLDLITVGRISVDLFAEQINTSFSQPQTFHKSIGGSPTNVAVAAAKLGHNAAIVTKVGVDPLGQYVQNKLNEMFHLIYDEETSNKPCCFTPTMMVKCCFQIWEKTSKKRTCY